MKLLNLICFLGANADLCTDYEIGTKCVGHCDNDKSACIFACENDVLCKYNCAVALDGCIQECPCFSECEQGCDGCANGICTCAYPDQNPDHVDCTDYEDFMYVWCLSECEKGDVHCLSVCGIEFGNNILECPCNVRLLPYA